MGLPFPDASFDAAVLPLVIFFIPDPLKGIRETVRVVRSGGWVAAYAWDLTGGGLPYQALQDEMRTMGLRVGSPPRQSKPSGEADRCAAAPRAPAASRADDSHAATAARRSGRSR